MRLWYWFLLIVLLIGLVLVTLGYYMTINENNNIGSAELGFELEIYSVFPLGFVLAVGLLYFERWRQRWWRR